MNKFILDHPLGNFDQGVMVMSGIFIAPEVSESVCTGLLFFREDGAIVVHVLKIDQVVKFMKCIAR